MAKKSKLPPIVSLVKLTNKDGMTRNGMLWGPNKTNSLKNKSAPKLCTPRVIHAYAHPIQAAVWQELHGYSSWRRPIWWAAKGRVLVSDNQKIGTKRLTTLRRMKPYKITRLHTLANGVLDGRDYRIWNIKKGVDLNCQKMLQGVRSGYDGNPLNNTTYERCVAIEKMVKKYQRWRRDVKKRTSK